jgi:uncharacterized membrane protein YqjE
VSSKASDDTGVGPLHGLLRQLLGDFSGMVGARVELLSLELRLASRALGTILALLAGAALMGFTAWIALWIALAHWALEAGLAWGWVAAGVVLANTAAAVAAVLRARRLFPLLGLPATVRRLSAPPLPAKAGEP